MDYLAFVLAGTLAGLCGGLFGIGGGLIIVPVLLWIFKLQGMNPEVIAHVALGTSLATIVVTSISSCTTHHKNGNVRWDILKFMAGGLMLGSLSGAWVAKLLHSDALQVIIGIGAVLMAIKMLFFANSEKLNKPMPKPSVQVGAGLGIGMLSAIFGIGGGTVTVPFLTSCGLPMKQAVGTSSACGLPIAVAGAMGFMFFGQGVATGVAGTVGFVHITAFLCIGVASFVMAKVGATFANKLPAKTLKKAFGVLLLVVGINIAYGGL